MNNVLLYLPETGGPEERILGMIDRVVSRANREIYSKFEMLVHRLQQIGEKPSVAVVLIREKEDLEQLYSIRHLFSDLRTLLILPDRSEETIAKGHAFFPRYMGYVDSNFIYIASVLEKTILHLKKEQLNKEEIWMNS